MSQMVLRPWEKVIANIKLVPKLILLMAFSTVLLLAKQLWDANTFRESVLEVTENQSHSIALRSAEMARTLLAQANGEALLEQIVAGENATSELGSTFSLPILRRKKSWDTRTSIGSEGWRCHWKMAVH